MVSRFEYHGKESLMEKRRQRRKEQLRNRAVALAAGLLLVGVCGVSSALAVTGGSGGLDVTDVPQDTLSLGAAPSSLVPAEGEAAWEGGGGGGGGGAPEGDAGRGGQLPAARARGRTSRGIPSGGVPRLPALSRPGTARSGRGLSRVGATPP